MLAMKSLLFLLLNLSQFCGIRGFLSVEFKERMRICEPCAFPEDPIFDVRVVGRAPCGCAFGLRCASTT